MHEFSLDKPIVKDIVGSGRVNLNIDWVLENLLAWQDRDR